MVSIEVKDGATMTHYFGISISQLTFLLSADRTVQDKTGLSGKYDISLRKPLPSTEPSGGQQQPAPMPQAEESSFSLAEQIGLKLEPAKGLVDTLVIDHIERPSAN
jgi:uncharacterized protein (TIGR03435 family)